MHSTDSYDSPTRHSARARASLLAIAVCCVGHTLFSVPLSARAAQSTVQAESTAIPRPAALRDDVNFWIRVYSEISTNEGFIHDERNLAVVYERLRFAANMPARERQKIIDDVRDRYSASLRRIAAALDASSAANAGTNAVPVTVAAGVAASAEAAPATADAVTSAARTLSAEDQRVLALWGKSANAQRLLEAAGSIRFQLGQSDRFREGLVRSTIWEGHIADVFANQGLPPELATLPHVESSFNPAAYSKVGAAGLWQFMRSTGRRYMRIDDAVDERLDPYRSTEAAAQLLAYNYRVLGTWPLALTAYNHGAGGLRRAKAELGTDDYVTINRLYRGRTFGFASRNFYPSFLAALTIDQDPEKYFGPIKRAAEEKFVEVAVPAYVRLSALEKATGVARDELRQMNPAFRPAVLDGSRLVPRGYRLRLPPQPEKLTSELLAERLGGAEQFVAQIEPRWYRVRRGDTLQKVASRYGMRTAALADLNDLAAGARLRPGRLLRLPDRMPAALARGEAPPAVAQSQTARTYVVKRGDSLKSIAAKVSVPEAELLKLNSLRDPDFIYEGQRIVIASAPAAGASANETEVKPDVRAIAAAETVREERTVAAAREVVEQQSVPRGEPRRSGRARPSRAPPSAAANAAVAQALKPAAAQPVTAGQAEADSPAVGPAAVATSVVTDAVEYAVANDGTIRVAAAETLGQYAEWSRVGANRIRTLNKLRPGKPVLLGQRLRMDFSKVSRETFEQERREFHARLQAQFFAEHRILGTEIYIARRGDTLWNVTQRFANLPIWLLQQYNPDVDLAELRAGTQVVVPRVEANQGSGGA